MLAKISFLKKEYPKKFFFSLSANTSQLKGTGRDGLKAGWCGSYEMYEILVGHCGGLGVLVWAIDASLAQPAAAEPQFNNSSNKLLNK